MISNYLLTIESYYDFINAYLFWQTGSHVISSVIFTFSLLITYIMIHLLISSLYRKIFKTLFPGLYRKQIARKAFQGRQYANQQRAGTVGENKLLKRLQKIPEIEIWDNLVFGEEKTSTQIDFVVFFKNQFFILEAKHWKNLDEKSSYGIQQQITRQIQNLRNQARVNIWVTGIGVWTNPRMTITGNNHVTQSCYVGDIERYLLHFKDSSMSVGNITSFKRTLDVLKKNSTASASQRHVDYWKSYHRN